MFPVWANRRGKGLRYFPDEEACKAYLVKQIACIDESGDAPAGCGYESGIRRRTRPDQAALSHSEAIRRLIEIALASKSKRQSTRDK